MVISVRALPAPVAVAFDCDGVLLDSNQLKTDAFRQVLLEAGYSLEAVNRFTELQTRSFGKSRYRLFDLFFSEILKTKVTSGTVDGLLAAFGLKCRLGYRDAAPTLGCLQILGALHGRVPLLVASGSDEEELRQVFNERGLSRYFAAIRGSPTPKSEILSCFVQSVSALQPGAFWFLGDAEADYDAAVASGATFIFVAGYSTARERMEALQMREGFVQIETLQELAALLP